MFRLNEKKMRRQGKKVRDIKHAFEISYTQIVANEICSFTEFEKNIE